MTLATAPVSDAPAPAKSFLLRFYFLYLILLGIPFTCLMAMLVFGVPYFREIFKDFKTALPVLTERLLSLSMMLESPLAWIPLVLVLLALPVPLATLQTRCKTATQQVTAFMIVTLIVLFLSFSAFMFIQVAMFLPLVKLIQSVSGEGPR